MGTRRVCAKPARVLGTGRTRPRRHRGHARPGPWGVEADLSPLSRPWVRARAGAQGLCVVSSRPPSAKSSWWACIRTPSVLVPHSPRPASGIPPCYRHGTRSLVVMALCNAPCTNKSWKIDVIRYLIWCPIISLIIILYIFCLASTQNRRRLPCDRPTTPWDSLFGELRRVWPPVTEDRLALKRRIAPCATIDPSQARSVPATSANPSLNQRARP